ncbi:flagellar hook-basal body protein [Syntrophomonas erecta]
MIKGLYNAGSGMMLQMARQDVIANNIANVNTAGFKKATAVTRAFPNMLITRMGETQVDNQGKNRSSRTPIIGGLGTGACLDGIATDYSLGNLKKTDNPFDLALSSDSYFVIETPEGERFTRNGQFKVNEAGLLTNGEGYPVLNDYDDFIYLEGEFSVDSSGYITINGEEAARLKVVRFPDQEVLQRVGGTLLTTDQEYQLVDQPGVLQGYTEESNVNAVQEMVTLISTVRAYESLQKVVQAEDETIRAAIEDIARV